MVGLIVLAVAAIYIVGWVFLVRLLKQRWLKIAAIAIALAIPFGDIPYGYGRYQYYCWSDGGVQRLRDFPATRAIYFPNSPTAQPEVFLKLGLISVEYGNRDGTVSRLYLTPNGIGQEQLSRPVSTVRISYRGSETLGSDLTRRELLVESNLNGDILMRSRSYSWKGGWLRNQLPWYGAAASCHPLSTRDLVQIISGERP